MQSYKEVKYIDIGSSFVEHIFLSKMQQSVCQSELRFRKILFQRIEPTKIPSMHTYSLVEFLCYVALYGWQVIKINKKTHMHVWSDAVDGSA